MSRSFSKIRHIQESNSRLEKRLLDEQGFDPKKVGSPIHKKDPVFKSVKELVKAANDVNSTHGTWGTYRTSPGMPKLLYFDFFGPPSIFPHKKQIGGGNIAKAFIDTKGKESGKWSIEDNTFFLDGVPISQ